MHQNDFDIKAHDISGFILILVMVVNLHVMVSEAH